MVFVADFGALSAVGAQHRNPAVAIVTSPDNVTFFTRKVFALITGNEIRTEMTVSLLASIALPKTVALIAGRAPTCTTIIDTNRAAASAAKTIMTMIAPHIEISMNTWNYLSSLLHNKLLAATTSNT